MVRTPFFDSNGMKKGAWNEEEDNKLRDFVLRHGHQNWRLVPKYAGLARCGKSCRLRWVNYLKPGVKRGNFSKEEEDLIIKLHAELGNKWSAIATKLPGRTDNEVKNHWHAHINRRRPRQYPPAKKVMWHTSEACSADQAMEEETTFALTPCETTQNESTSLDASALVKPQQSELSLDTYPSVLPITQSQVDLWPDRLLADTNCSRNDCFPPLLEEEFYHPQLPFCELSRSDSSYLSALDWIADDNHSIICSEFFTQPVQESVWSGSFVSNNISNSQSESSCVPPQEDGGLYDPLLQYFDYGMNLLR